ncbi:MAG: hypothetical protein ACLP1Y_16970 [Candidatus Acidiferrales bacterium]
MMAKSIVLLTADDLLRWRQEEKQLEQRLGELRLMIEAAERFAARVPEAAELLSVRAAEVTAEAQRSTPANAESIPARLVANLRETGEALTVKQIRQRLSDLGFAERVRDQPNYHYSIAHKLVKRGKLLKQGALYRAAPFGEIDQGSPEGGAEGVGPSANY